MTVFLESLLSKIKNLNTTLKTYPKYSICHSSFHKNDMSD